MANPPFNVDEVDADKVKNDPRLPFGLPGASKNEKVSNGNYNDLPLLSNNVSMVSTRCKNMSIKPETFDA
jgi:hypothetical protein